MLDYKQFGANTITCHKTKKYKESKVNIEKHQRTEAYTIAMKHRSIM